VQAARIAARLRDFDRLQQYINYIISSSEVHVYAPSVVHLDDMLSSLAAVIDIQGSRRDATGIDD
jgi:hypothetical protein